MAPPVVRLAAQEAEAEARLAVAQLAVPLEVRSAKQEPLVGRATVRVRVL